MGTVPSTSVTMTAIKNEFGGDGAISLSDYYRGTRTVFATGTTKIVRPEVSAIPLSGAISIGDFRGQDNSPGNTPKGMTIGQFEFKGSFTKGYSDSIFGDSFSFGDLRNRYMIVKSSAGGPWGASNVVIGGISQGGSGVLTLDFRSSATNSTWSSITIDGNTILRNSMTYTLTSTGFGNPITRYEKTVSLGVLHGQTAGTSITVSFT